MDDPHTDTHRDEALESQTVGSQAPEVYPGEGREPGFFLRWIAPLLFVLTVMAVFWLLARMSVPMLGPDSEVPEEHFASACSVCHRSETGFDPAALSGD